MSTANVDAFISKVSPGYEVELYDGLPITFFVQVDVDPNRPIWEPGVSSFRGEMEVIIIATDGSGWVYSQRVPIQIPLNRLTSTHLNTITFACGSRPGEYRLGASIYDSAGNKVNELEPSGSGKITLLPCGTPPTIPEPEPVVVPVTCNAADIEVATIFPANAIVPFGTTTVLVEGSAEITNYNTVACNVHVFSQIDEPVLNALYNGVVVVPAGETVAIRIAGIARVDVPGEWLFGRITTTFAFNNFGGPQIDSLLEIVLMRQETAPEPTPSPSPTPTPTPTVVLPVICVEPNPTIERAFWGSAVTLNGTPINPGCREVQPGKHRLIINAGVEFEIHDEIITAAEGGHYTRSPVVNTPVVEDLPVGFGAGVFVCTEKQPDCNELTEFLRNTEKQDVNGCDIWVCDPVSPAPLTCDPGWALEQAYNPVTEEYEDMCVKIEEPPLSGGGTCFSKEDTDCLEGQVPYYTGIDDDNGCMIYDCKAVDPAEVAAKKKGIAAVGGVGVLALVIAAISFL